MNSANRRKQNFSVRSIENRKLFVAAEGNELWKDHFTDIQRAGWLQLAVTFWICIWELSRV